MDLTSLISTAAGNWIPWAATAATNLASQTAFASLLGSPPSAESEPASSIAAAEPDFPLSSSDRDRLERLLNDDLDALANLLRANPAFSGDDQPTFDLLLNPSGEVKGTVTESQGQMRELDLSGSDEISSLLRRMTSCLKRLSPGAGEGVSESSQISPWNIRVDGAGARLLDSP